MTYPPDPQTPIGKTLREKFDREALKVVLMGSPAVIDQGVIELERRGFCDSYAWTRPLVLPQDTVILQPQPGEQMRLYKRWYPFTGQRIPL